jgi:hypothetical protein
VLDPHGVPGVKCKACRQFFKHPGLYKNTFSTSTLGRHQTSCKNLKRLSKSIDNADISKLFSKPPNIPDFPTENHVKDTILSFFISGNIPFSQADNPEF